MTQTVAKRMCIDNVNVYYEYHQSSHNSGNRTFLLIHGFLSSTFSFRQLIPLLRKKFNVVSVDLPGFGKSEKSLTFRYSYANYAQIMIRLIDRLSLRNTVLIGHSMGGQIALNVAKQIPDTIERCILLSSSAYLKKARRIIIYSSYLPFVGYFMKQWFGKKDVKKNLRTVVYDPSLITKEMIAGYSEPFYEKGFLDCMLRLLRHREGDMTSDELRTIQTPCLVVWGKEDRVIPLKIGEKLVTDLPQAKLVCYEKTGHLVSEEKPQQLYDDILQFLNE